MANKEEFEEHNAQIKNEITDIADLSDDELMDMELEIEPGPETALFWQ